MRAFRRTVRVAAALAALPLLVTGCSINQAFEDVTRIDYKSASTGPKLDIPPDLVTPRQDDRFAIPDRPSAGTSYSDFARDRANPRPAGTAAGVLVQPPSTRIERQGSQRWLVVSLPPAQVWPIVRSFWTNAGFALRIESPETGILETDWAEKRPNVPDSWLRNTLSRAIGSLYATAERDKFRTRLESDGNTTEIFISHRGLVEEFSGAQKETTVWVQRPSDPELEAEFLRRLMVRFAQTAPGAAPSGSAEPAAGTSATAPDRARVIDVDGRPVVEMSQDGFDRAWRQVGLALDRSGFTVEDRDRSKGTFFVRYVDPEQEARTRGMIDRVFGTGSGKDLSGRKYRITVEGAGSGSRIGVLDENGNLPSTDADRRVASRIVSLLRDQLR